MESQRLEAIRIAAFRWLVIFANGDISRSKNYDRYELPLGRRARLNDGKMKSRKREQAVVKCVLTVNYRLETN